MRLMEIDLWDNDDCKLIEKVKSSGVKQEEVNKVQTSSQTKAEKEQKKENDKQVAEECPTINNIADII